MESKDGNESGITLNIGDFCYGNNLIRLSPPLELKVHWCDTGLVWYAEDEDMNVFCDGETLQDLSENVAERIFSFWSHVIREDCKVCMSLVPVKEMYRDRVKVLH